MKPEQVITKTQAKKKPGVRHASYLSPPDMHRLDWACRPIYAAFGSPPFLVGSVLTRPDFRDIDLRLILPDDDVNKLCSVGTNMQVSNLGSAVLLLLNIAISDLIARSANAQAPIDFQIQSMTEANVPEHGLRNPMGIRWDGEG